MAAHIGYAVFDALAPTPKIGWAQFDAKSSRPSIGWVEFDVRANPNDSHDENASSSIGARARRAIISRAPPQNSPIEAATRYHGRSDEQERMLAAQLDDEEVVIAFLMALSLQ